MNGLKIALTHAGSPASAAILEKLPDIGIELDTLVLLGDESSAGTRLSYAGSYLSVEDQQEYDYSQCSLVLMPVYDAAIETKLASLDALLVSHAVAGDEDAVFAGRPDADINVSYTQSSVRLAGPELACLLGVLPTLHNEYDIKRINLVFLRSAESLGKSAVDELASQTIALLNGREITPEAYPTQIAFNLLPASQYDSLNTDLGQLLANRDISCSHQIVDVPVFHGLVASVQLEFASEVDLAVCEKHLNALSAVQVVGAGANPISDCNQSFNCVINGLTQSQRQSKALQFWMIADPMRYGLANNYANATDILLKSFL